MEQNMEKTITEKEEHKTETNLKAILPRDKKESWLEAWWKNKAMPLLSKATDAIGKALAGVRINWTGLLILVILAYLAKNGFLDEVPGIKWLVESAVRLTEWVINLLRSIIQICVNSLDSKFINALDIFGLFEWFEKFLRSVFAL